MKDAKQWRGECYYVRMLIINLPFFVQTIINKTAYTFTVLCMAFQDNCSISQGCFNLNQYTEWVRKNFLHSIQWREFMRLLLTHSVSSHSIFCRFWSDIEICPFWNFFGGVSTDSEFEDFRKFQNLTILNPKFFIS